MHAPEAGPSSPDHATTTGERAVIARVSDGRNAITSLSAVLISTYTAFGQHRAHFAHRGRRRGPAFHHGHIIMNPAPAQPDGSTTRSAPGERSRFHRIQQSRRVRGRPTEYAGDWTHAGGAIYRRRGGALGGGREALSTGRWEEARAGFEAALEIEESGEALFGLALALWWLRDPVNSVRFQERAFGRSGGRETTRTPSSLRCTCASATT